LWLYIFIQLKTAVYTRKPLRRYLTRYRGPSPEQTTFRDDYVGHNVCLRSIDFANGKFKPPIDCTLEFYGNIIDSCDILIEELYLHFALEKRNTVILPELTLNFLPWRKSLHRRYEHNPVDILTKVNGRAAGFGIAALTVFNLNGEFVAARGLRSSKVGTYPGTYHVIPAGMTNVEINDYESNKYLLPNDFLNVQLLIEKEFLEEVFSVDWARSCKVQPEKWPSLVKEHVKKNLFGESNDYNTKIYLTGIVFDLLNYRPEICILILIKDKEWWNNHSPYTTTKHQPVWKVSYEWEKMIKPINVFDENNVLNAMPLNRSVMSGVAAFYLGIQKARTLLG